MATYYEIRLTVVTENPDQAMHVSETLNRVSTGFALEGIQSAQSIDIDEDYYGDDETEAAATEDEKPY